MTPDDKQETTMNEFDCPQCGEPTERLHDGYCAECCAECCAENQRALDLHNAEVDHWHSLSDAERGDAIRRAIRHG